MRAERAHTERARLAVSGGACSGEGESHGTAAALELLLMNAAAAAAAAGGE